MAKKTITVSDISGDMINEPGEGVKVVITFNSTGAKYTLDAHEHEVEDLVNQARRKPTRKYTKKQVETLDAAMH